MMEKNNESFKPYQIQNTFRELQDKNKELQREVKRGDQELEKRKKIEIDLRKELKNKVDEWADKHEKAELDNHSTIAGLSRMVKERDEKLRGIEESAATLPPLVFQ